MADVPPPHVPAPPRSGYGSAQASAERTYAYNEDEQRGTRGIHPTGASTGLHIPGASALYTLLGLLLLAGGVLALIMSNRLTDVFFRGHRAYYDVIFEELWRLLGSSLLAASITAYSLKIASDRQSLNDPVVQRLQLGFFWFALLSIILHLVHVLFLKSLTLWGLLIGAVIMAPTLLLPSVHLGMSGGFGLAAAADSVSTAFGNVFAPRHVTFTVALYSLLTVLFAIVGLGYIIIPKLTLKWALGYHAGKRAVFLWQWIGSAMVFLFPSITYTLLERGIGGYLWRTIPKSLNVALLLAALFHILEFGSLLASEGIAGRWLLPVLLGHWVLTLLAAVMGLSATGETPVYEYEPLQTERGGMV